MTDQNPATPASAATPGSNGPGTVPPSTTPPASNNGAPGTPPESMVTMPAKEFAQLNRDAARYRSFARRSEFTNSRNNRANTPPANSDPNDPIAQELHDANQRASRFEQSFNQERLANRVRELLNDKKYAALPVSVRKLVADNPQMLSKAQDVEEQLLDVQDYLDDLALTAVTTTPSTGQPAPQSAPPTRETPPIVSGGAPAPAPATQLEDLSKLHGQNKSRAAIRNILRTAKGQG